MVWLEEDQLPRWLLGPAWLPVGRSRGGDLRSGRFLDHAVGPVAARLRTSCDETALEAARVVILYRADMLISSAFTAFDARNGGP